MVALAIRLAVLFLFKHFGIVHSRFRGCCCHNACKVVEMENEVTAVHIDFVAQYGYNIIRILLLRVTQEQEVLL